VTGFSTPSYVRRTASSSRAWVAFIMSRDERRNVGWILLEPVVVPGSVDAPAAVAVAKLNRGHSTFRGALRPYRVFLGKM
jgi:hypothetical protein